MTVKQCIRKKSALERLEKQLISGVKPDKKTGALIPLEDSDKLRIKEEIYSLTNKIKTYEQGIKKGN
jgi:hypothetical protein